MAEILDREQGIAAVIGLQKLEGIDETQESAAAGWEAMTPADQRFTLAMFSVVCEVQAEAAAEEARPKIKVHRVKRARAANGRADPHRN